MCPVLDSYGVKRQCKHFYIIMQRLPAGTGSTRCLPQCVTTT